MRISIPSLLDDPAAETPFQVEHCTDLSSRYAVDWFKKIDRQTKAVPIVGDDGRDGLHAMPNLNESAFTAARNDSFGRFAGNPMEVVRVDPGTLEGRVITEISPPGRNRDEEGETR